MSEGGVDLPRQIDPAAPMPAIGNAALDEIAATVRDKLAKVVAAV